MPRINLFEPLPLVGVAIGDAMGMPFEMQPHDNPDLLAWKGGFVDGIYHHLKKGQYTDDTQMTLALARVLAAFPAQNIRNPLDAKPLKRQLQDAYMAWYESGPRGIGGTLRRAILGLLRHKAENPAWPDNTPRPDTGIPEARGTGTAMRAIPLGLWNTPDRRIGKLQLWEFVANMDARITHDSKHGEAGSCVVAYMAMRLSQQTPSESIKDIVVGAAMRINDILGVKVPAVERLVMLLEKERPADLVGATVSLAQACATESSDHMPVIDMLVTGMYILANANTFEEAVETAVRVGGDTDTRAAMVGGLAALRHPIPQDWVDQVENAPLLIELGRELMYPVPPPPESSGPFAALYAAPRRWRACCWHTRCSPG